MTEIVKIKSHMTQEQFLASRASKSDFMANEVVDKIAEKAAMHIDSFSTWYKLVKANEGAHVNCELIVKSRKKRPQL